MKFTSKNTNYHSPQANRGVFTNPFVKSVSSLIDTENERLTVNFALQYDNNGVVQTLERTTLQFNKVGQETLIETVNAEDEIIEVEILEHLQAGGTYDSTKITQWGEPSFARVQEYFDLASAWSDLAFKEQPLKQLAIDWLLNVLKIEGKLLKENFELEVV